MKKVLILAITIFATASVCNAQNPAKIDSLINAAFQKETKMYVVGTTAYVVSPERRIGGVKFGDGSGLWIATIHEPVADHSTLPKILGVDKDDNVYVFNYTGYSMLYVIAEAFMFPNIKKVFGLKDIVFVK